MKEQNVIQVSMSQRLTLAIALAMTFIVVLIATGFYQYTATGLEKTFNRKVEQNLSYLDGALAPLLWNFDHDTIARVAETAMRSELVVGVTIRGEDGKNILSISENSLDPIVMRTQKIHFEDKVVGELELLFSRGPLSDTLTGILLISLSVWLVTVLVMSGLIYLFIRKYFRGLLASLTDLAISYRQNPEPSPSVTTRFFEIQQIEEVVKKLADDVLIQLRESRESEAHYRSIFENALYGIVATGLDSKFIKVNDAWCKLIGYTRDELLNNMGIADVTLNEDLPETTKNIKKLISREIKQIVFEKRYKAKSGQIIEAMIFVRGIYDEDGKYIGNAASIMDITERKRAEKELEKHQLHLETMVEERTRELAESERKYHDYYEHTPDLQVSVDAVTGRIIECNETAAKATGYTKSEITGKKVLELYHPDSLEAAQRCFKQFVETGEVHDEELRLKRKDGSAIDVVLGATNYVSPDGKHRYSRSVWHDITERKKAESLLKKAKEETDKLNVRLLEIDQLKSMFIASMSHELRTPLNSIIGFTGIVLNGMTGKLEPRQKDFLGRAYRSSKHLSELISDVIDISKIESGVIEAYPEPFFLNNVVTEALDSAMNHRKKEVELKVTISEDIKMYSDRKRVLQCILNLLSNALKYTQKGIVNISTIETDNEVEIRVEDTGIGIAETDIEKLFSAFERLNSPLRITEAGTGLGLYLTRKLTTEVLGGSLRVESNLGKGSTFYLAIPKFLQQKKSDTEISNLEITE